jgi:hypothetical protein
VYPGFRAAVLRLLFRFLRRFSDFGKKVAKIQEKGLSLIRFSGRVLN